MDGFHFRCLAGLSSFPFPTFPLFHFPLSHEVLRPVFPMRMHYHSIFLQSMSHHISSHHVCRHGHSWLPLHVAYCSHQPSPPPHCPRPTSSCLPAISSPGLSQGLYQLSEGRKQKIDILGWPLS